MNTRVTNITSMVESPEEERRARMRQYLLTMVFRSCCVLLLLFVRGPLIWVVAASAIFLPWIAVVLANHVRERRRKPVVRPEVGQVDIIRPRVTAEDWARATPADDDDETTRKEREP